jgi:hypothetical protein
MKSAPHPTANLQFSIFNLKSPIIRSSNEKRIYTPSPVPRLPSSPQRIEYNSKKICPISGSAWVIEVPSKMSEPNFKPSTLEFQP